MGSRDEWDEALKKMVDIPDQDEAEGEDCLTLAQLKGDYSVLRPANKPIERLHVVLKDGGVETFLYAYLGVNPRFMGGGFVVVFAGEKHWEVTVKGHGNLWRIYDYITLKRWPYLRVETRDFDDKKTAITAIGIKDITPRLVVPPAKDD